LEKITDRIKDIITNERISVRQMEIAIGCSNGVLSKAIKQGTDISAVWVSKIIEKYKIYNPGWLLTGIGEMIIIKEENSKEELKPPENNYFSQLLDTKNELIASLRQQIQIQADYINNLKESSSQKSGEQKRKAG
jgi:hypothetical protein